MSAHPESAISRLRPTAERRGRTTTVALQTSAQNGTSGVLRMVTGTLLADPVDQGPRTRAREFKIDARHAELLSMGIESQAAPAGWHPLLIVCE